MIKGRMVTATGDPALVLGLSGENMTRLTGGEPILVRPREVAVLGLPPITVVIHYGQTAQDILTELAAHGMDLDMAAGTRTAGDIMRGVLRITGGPPATLFLGLTGETVTRVTGGEPALIRGADLAAMGLPQVGIQVRYGRTEQAIADEIRPDPVR